AGPAAQALRKLEASGLTRDTRSVAGVEPLLHTVEPAFDTARDAVLARREITFRYRRGSAGEVTQRHLQPWALTSWHGRWYLTGHDLDRQAPRVFRLDRIEGTVRAHGASDAYQVPADHDPRAMITRTADPEADLSVRVALRSGAGQPLRRRGQLRAARGPRGWDVVEVRVGALWPMIEEVASLG